jgi:transposase
MKIMRQAIVIELSAEQKQQLRVWSRRRTSPLRLVQRSKIVLLAAEGKTNHEISATLGIERTIVGRWRKRFAERGLSGIEKDLPRGGRKPSVRHRLTREIVRMTTQETPKDATHWSTRTLAAALGTNRSMVHRVWEMYGLKPHLVNTFKVSNDRHFAEKVMDVTGLYLDPPEHALVLCVDEKSQIQALDRTQKSLPLFPGRLGTLTHDYKRNGTTTLFAALELLEGKLIGTCMPHHRQPEWVKFLRQIDRETPPKLDLHLIVDNYVTHTCEATQRWLKRHPRFHVHLIPTSSSWLNLVERWFAELSRKRLKRGVFHSVEELIDIIMTAVQQHNDNPKPFHWTAKAEDILTKFRHARAALDTLRSE